jgi:hypothetical protein
VYLGLLEDDDAEFEISTRQRQLTAVLEERISTEAELLQIEEYLRSVRVNHRFSGVALLALHAEQGVRPGTAFSWALISLACLEGILSFETLVPETIHSAIRRSVVRGVAGIVVVGVALVSGLRTPAVSVAVEYGTLILLALPLAGLPPLKHVYPEGLAGRIARLLRSWVVFAHYEYVLAVVLMTFIVLPAWNRLLDLDGSWTRLFAARLFVDRNTASARGLLITPACVLLARNAASNYRQAFVQSGSLRRTAAEQADFAYGLLHSFVKPQLDNASHELEANGSAGRGPLRRAQAMLSDAMRQLQLGDPDYGETRDVLYTVLPRMDAGVRWNTNVGVATRDLSVADRQLMLFVVNDLVRNAEQANASSAQLSISRLPLGSDRESIEVGVTCDCGKNLDQSAPFRGLAQLQTRLQLRGGDLRLIPGSPHRWLASWPLTPTGRAL